MNIYKPPRVIFWMARFMLSDIPATYYLSCKMWKDTHVFVVSADHIQLFCSQNLGFTSLTHLYYLHIFDTSQGKFSLLIAVTAVFSVTSDPTASQKSCT